MEPLIQMNKFEVVDMPGMSTIAFLVEKNEEEYKRGNALLSLQKFINKVKLFCEVVKDEQRKKTTYSITYSY